MKKPPIRVLIKAKAAALRSADPKSRDRIRRELRALEVAREIKKQCRAA
jgi:hypothetical protein